jgi:hypothetical protein
MLRHYIIYSIQCVLKTNLFSSTLKNTLAYYLGTTLGFVVVNSEVVGLAPGSKSDIPTKVLGSHPACEVGKHPWPLIFNAPKNPVTRICTCLKFCLGIK